MGHANFTILQQLLFRYMTNGFEELEDEKLVCKMMIDLSAAFDMVDHQLLLEKLKLFGLQEEVLVESRVFLLMNVCLRQLVLIMGSPKALYGTSHIRHLYQ